MGISDGNGGFAMTTVQTYGASGWDDYSRPSTGDFNGDGRTDLVWHAACPGTGCESIGNGIRTGLANADGTFLVTSTQTLGTREWPIIFDVADVDGDGKDDLVWSESARANDTNVATLLTAISNGNGTFTLGPARRVRRRRPPRPPIRGSR